MPKGFTREAVGEAKGLDKPAASVAKGLVPSVGARVTGGVIIIWTGVFTVLGFELEKNRYEPTNPVMMTTSKTVTIMNGNFLWGGGGDDIVVGCKLWVMGGGGGLELAGGDGATLTGEIGTTGLGSGLVVTTVDTPDTGGWSGAEFIFIS